MKNLLRDCVYVYICLKRLHIVPGNRQYNNNTNLFLDNKSSSQNHNFCAKLKCVPNREKKTVFFSALKKFAVNLIDFGSVL